jgi:hypothetical protein
MATTAATVFAMVRSFLGDDDGNVFTDAFMTPAIASNHRLLQTALVNKGCSVLRDTSDAITVTAGSLSTLTLPTDLIVPYKLWERPVSGTADQWQLMTAVIELADRTVNDTLGEWVFEAGTINFIGCTANREVKVQYEKQLPTITAAATSLNLNGAEDALAYLLCQDMAISRGQLATADRYAKKAEFAIGELAGRFTKGNQAVHGRRRLAYGRSATGRH